MNDEEMTFQYIDRNTYKDDSKLLMYFPHDGSYVEILGHKIDFQGGYEEFVEHLKKLATYEEENEQLKKTLTILAADVRAYESFKKDFLEQEKMLKASVKYYVDILTDLKKWLEEDEEKAMISFAAGKHFNYKDILNKIKELEAKNNDVIR